MDLDQSASSTTFTVLITGANSGLGFASCCRLIDEFIATRQDTQSIHLLFSTRDARKRTQTLQKVNKHLGNTLSARNGSTQSLHGPRITIEGVLVDLTRLTTVKQLAEDLVKRGQHIDAVICNAGIGGWIGLIWGRAIYSILLDFKQATTFPTYQACAVGAVTKPQLQAGVSKEQEPVLGEVFTANVFGHYMLVHWLAPLMDGRSRIVWVSSLSAQQRYFEPDDFQHLATTEAYESSKRITDLLVLSSELPSTRTSVESFLPSKAGSTRPTLYLTHPGVVHTSIAGLPWFLDIVIMAAFYLARLLGSPWHTVTAYPGACSAVWTVLSPESQIKEREVREGKGKWGSVIDVHGNEGVKRTEVDGWGYCGSPGVIPSGSVSGSAGRYRERLKDTAEAREQFEVDGRLVWHEMEDLRKAWEKRLAA